MAQEAFVRAWRHAGAFDPRRGSVATWLSTITRNLALDHLRSRRSRPFDAVDPMTLVLTASAPGPEAQAVLGDDTARVVGALRGLPEAQCRALVFATLGGRTAREIGEIDGVPLGTAKTRIRSALQGVRAAMAEDEAPRG